MFNFVVKKVSRVDVTRHHLFQTQDLGYQLRVIRIVALRLASFVLDGNREELSFLPCKRDAIWITDEFDHIANPRNS
ncbi:hypothetical protein D1872_311280 [compost metagenome]